MEHEADGCRHKNASKSLGVYVVTYDSTGNFALAVAWGSEDAQDLIDDDPMTLGWGPCSSVRSVQRNVDGPRGVVYWGQCHPSKEFSPSSETKGARGPIGRPPKFYFDACRFESCRAHHPPRRMAQAMTHNRRVCLDGGRD